MNDREVGQITLALIIGGVFGVLLGILVEANRTPLPVYTKYEVQQ